MAGVASVRHDPRSRHDAPRRHPGSSPRARGGEAAAPRVRARERAPKPLPAWADVALIPLLNVAAAFLISGLVVLAIGENPIEAVQILIAGALGDLEGIGFTLYYATSFIFTGLAVAICFHAGLFNIGVEGQAYVAGLGAALAALYLGLPARLQPRHRRDPRRARCSAPPSPRFPAICRPSATATSSSRRSCSTTSPRR